MLPAWTQLDCRGRREFRPGALSLPFLLVLVTAVFTPPVLGAEELPAKFRAAVDLFVAGDFGGCQTAFGQAVSEAPRAGLAARAAYGAACCAALRQDSEGAFAALMLALSKGFIDLDRALVDPRLDVLRSDPRWLQFVSLTEERLLAHRKTLDPDLLRLYLEKQGGRAGLDREPVSGGAGSEGGAGLSAALSAERRSETWKLIEGGRVKAPEDAFHAAALLVESDRAEEVDRAAALARQALAGDPDLLAAKPLVATAVDRGEMLAGRPQKYGTQLVAEGEAWKVYTVDPSITDAEREEWGVPPLAQTQARVAELKALPAPAKP